jgi:hypothetical protein
MRYPAPASAAGSSALIHGSGGIWPTCGCHCPTDLTIAQVFPHAHTTHFQLRGGFPLTNRYLIGRATT